ncbi:MAG: hypothetical protein ABL927_12860 [Bdellovibrionales bacterium]
MSHGAQGCAPLHQGGRGMLSGNEISTGFFLFAIITGLLTISYWSAISEIEEIVEDEDFFID